jgi:hypothetical protein
VRIGEPDAHGLCKGMLKDGTRGLFPLAKTNPQ